MHGRTLVEMAVVRVCQLGELDELAALVAELRGTTATRGDQPTAPASPMTSKKNAEPPVAIRLPDPQPIARAPALSETNEPPGRRTDPPHRMPEAPAPTDVETAPPLPAAAESVLAQWQRAVADGTSTRIEAPPRTSRREQLAEISERPFVRRALELFDVPAGQFRYSPPEGDGN